MVRSITALVLAAVLAATVYAVAASLGGIGNTDLAADDAVIAACDSNGVTTSYTVAYNGGIRVRSVRVSGIADTCRGNVVDVFLTKAGNELGTQTAPVEVGSAGDNFAELSFGASGPLAGEVNEIHISIR